MTGGPTLEARAPIRVLHVVGVYPTETNPMALVFVKAQIESLRRLGVECDVLVLCGRGLGKYRTGPSQIRARLRERPADVIHAHYSYCGWTALGLGLPVVVSFLGTDLYGPAGGAAPWRWVLRQAHRRLARRVADAADASIVKSERMRVALGRPCAVIPNGVDLDRFSPPAAAADIEGIRRRLGLLSPEETPSGEAARHFLVLFAGGPQNPVKRYPLARDAVELAARELGSPIELVVVHGKPQTELADYMRAADLLLLTSSHEGSPNVVKEAIGCNLPVVTVDVGDVRERLAGCRESRVVDGDSPVAIGGAIAAVLRGGRRDQGRESIRPLGLAMVAERVRAVYRDVLTP